MQEPQASLPAPAQTVISTALDALVADSVEDDVALAANELLSQYDSLYGPALDACQSLQHDIPSDPVQLGLAQFNERLSAVRHTSNQTAPWLSAVVRDRNTARERWEKAKAAYEEKFNLTLTQNEEVLNHPGAFQAKQALTKHLLLREERIVRYAEQIYRRLSTYYDALKVIHDNLAETKNDMMKQLAVVKQQINIGEVNPTSFPLRGQSVPQPGSLRETEQAVAAELDVTEGEASF